MLSLITLQETGLPPVNDDQILALKWYTHHFQAFTVNTTAGPTSPVPAPRATTAHWAPTQARPLTRQRAIFAQRASTAKRDRIHLLHVAMEHS